MLTARRALISGCFLTATACLVGCFLPALLEPQPPWTDPVAQQARWSHTLGWLLGAAAILLIGAYVLLAYGWTKRRAERRITSRSPDQR